MTPFPLRAATLLAPLWLVACAGWAPSPEHIVETATGRTVPCAALADAVLRGQYALLGEQHDEPTHHQRRGALIERLRGTPTVVVAEQLPHGAPVAGLQGPLLPALEAAGFRAKAWGWPLHQPLFEGIAASGLPLRGGDLTGDELRQLMQPGAAARAAGPAIPPLDDVARAALEADLTEAHGGTVPPQRLEAMRHAQRARDAALLQALQASGGPPAVLVAGNGHVRGDYGVPQLLRASQPQARVINVALVRPGEPVPGGAQAYTHVWTIDPAVPVRACER